MGTQNVGQVRTIAGGGWRGWDRLSDRECRRIGVRRGSIVNPQDCHLVIYSPASARYGGGYDNSRKRASDLIRQEPRS
jgi:hypothetical protein